METAQNCLENVIVGNTPSNNDGELLKTAIVAVEAASVSTSPAIPPDGTALSAVVEPLSLPPSQKGWEYRHIHRWKSPLLMVVFFVIGLAMSLAHCIFYPSLSGRVVGNSDAQEEKIRFSTAFSFLSQICLRASVWTSLTQWLWRTVKRKEMTVDGLNAAFGADTSVLSLLDLEMLRKLRIGSIMAAFAWGLLLPPFFTPATLFVYQSLNGSMSVASKYAYSPPARPGTTQFVDDTSRIFTGPLTIVSLIAASTASLGEILPIKLPPTNTSHNIDFFAPTVQCSDANASTIELTNQFLRQEMKEGDDVVIETNCTYYSFVPSYNETGSLVAMSKPRLQTPSNATNELWMTFLRTFINESGTKTTERKYQVCNLYNATYNLHIERDHGLQNITRSYEVHNQVFYPQDTASSVSNMAQHAYTAIMWGLADQLAGKFSWYVNTAFNNSAPSSTPSRAAQFGVLQSPIQRTSLLGSSDLDAYFDLDEERSLYKKPEGNGSLSDQRPMDKALARNRTLDVLIEELSFNISVGLMWNSLLTQTKLVPTNITSSVNRYAYKAHGLFIPYALANTFAFLIVLVGIYSCIFDGPMANKKFQDIVSAAEDPEIVHVMRDRKRSVTAIMRNEKIVLRAGTNIEQEKKWVFPVVVGLFPKRAAQGR